MTYEEIKHNLKIIEACDSLNMHNIINIQNSNPSNPTCSKCKYILNTDGYYKKKNIETYLTLIHRAIHNKPIEKFISNISSDPECFTNQVELMNIGEKFYKDFYNPKKKNKNKILIVSLICGYLDSSTYIPDIILNIKYNNIKHMAAISNLTKYTVNFPCHEIFGNKLWNKYQIEALGDIKTNKFLNYCKLNFRYNFSVTYDKKFMINYLTELVNNNEIDEAKCITDILKCEMELPYTIRKKIRSSSFSVYL